MMIGQGYYFEDTIKSSSPTTDFAFQPPPPQEYKAPPSQTVPPVPYPLTIPPQGQFSGIPSSAAGPFTIMSGTVTPVDLSVDTTNALPRISRDFAPPSMSDTRRPATTAGSLHRREDASAHSNGFSNPFTSSPADIVPSQSSAVDTHYQSDSATSWHSPTTTQPMSYPATAVGVTHYSNGLLNPAARTASVTRPQTSDGLPSYPSHVNGGGPLPSARSLVAQLGSYQSSAVPTTYTSVGGQVMSGYPAGRYGSYDQNAGRYSMSGQSSESDLQFVSLPGPIAPRKRSRRRYDEIERIYHCNYKGCDKAYGTLNHLNAHVAMQKHGEKRLPAQFKEMRKEWRRKKRDEAAEAANKELQAQAVAAAAAAGVGPNPSPYQWENRHSTADPSSLYSSYSTSASVPVDSEPYGHHGSTSSLFASAPTWSSSDTRPTTANTVSSDGSPTDGRFGYGTNAWSSVYGRKPDLSMSSTQSAAAPPATFTPYGMNHHNLV